jgi:hypothetical protein
MAAEQPFHGGCLRRGCHAVAATQTQSVIACLDDEEALAWNGAE